MEWSREIFAPGLKEIIRVDVLPCRNMKHHHESLTICWRHILLGVKMVSVRSETSFAWVLPNAHLSRFDPLGYLVLIYITQALIVVASLNCLMSQEEP